MEECDVCLTRIKKQSIKKHKQTKKQKYFSKLILNRYIVINPEIDKYKNNIQSYYNEPKRKVDDFTVRVIRKKNDSIINKISVPSIIKLRKLHLFEPGVTELPNILKIPAFDFPDQFNEECVNDMVDEINILFISDLNDITFFHYMEQPKSMLCRKLIQNVIGEDYGVFDSYWLPKCFRNI